MIGRSSPRGQRMLRLAVGSSALLAAAAILGWRAGAPRGQPAFVPPPAAWSLPQWQPESDQGDRQALLARRPWSKGAPLLARPGEAPAEWRFLGVVERGGRRLALISTGSGPEARVADLAVGAPLPDGSVVVQIGTDSMTSQNTEPSAVGNRVYRLFAKAR